MCLGVGEKREKKEIDKKVELLGYTERRVWYIWHSLVFVSFVWIKGENWFIIRSTYILADGYTPRVVWIWSSSHDTLFVYKLFWALVSVCSTRKKNVGEYVPVRMSMCVWVWHVYSPLCTRHRPFHGIPYHLVELNMRAAHKSSEQRQEHRPWERSHHFLFGRLCSIVFKQAE